MITGLARRGVRADGRRGLARYSTLGRAHWMAAHVADALDSVAFETIVRGAPGFEPRRSG